MGAFNTRKSIATSLSDATDVVKEVEALLIAEGYKVNTEQIVDGYFISLSKGGFFKSVSGLATSLNVTIKTVSGGMSVEAGVGIFGQQALPTAVFLFVTWPVIITQVIGMVKQSKLDEKVIDMIETAVRNAEAAELAAKESVFCHECGKSIEAGSVFCPLCGAGQ